MVFLGILGAAILGGMVYLAMSKKSDLKVRIASLCALGLMVVSVIVCLLMFVKSTRTFKPLLLPDMDIADVPPPPPSNHHHMVLMFIILIVALFVMVIVFSLREQARISGKKEEDVEGWE